MLIPSWCVWEYWGFQSNVRFNEMFGSMEDLRGFIWQHKLEPVYAWSR